MTRMTTLLNNFHDMMSFKLNLRSSFCGFCKHYGAFTLPDTDTDTVSDTEKDDNGFNSNICLCRCLCSENSSIERIVVCTVTVSGNVNTPLTSVNHMSPPCIVTD